MSSSFYEAFYRKAKERIPDFLFDEVKAQALPLSGAEARWKASSPTIFERIVLPDLSGKLSELSNQEVKSVLRRVNKLFVSARRAKAATEVFSKAAAQVVKEMRQRNMNIDHKLAVLQEFVGKSDEELDEYAGKEDVEKRYGPRTANTGAPVSARGFTAAESLQMAEENGAWSPEGSNYEPRSREAYKSCGTCRFFLRDANSAVGRCQIVTGPINWFGTSDLYISAEQEAYYAFNVAEHAVHEEMMDQAFGIEKAFEGGGSNPDENTDPKKPKMVITAKELIQKRIKRDGKEYVVTDDSGKKELGRHPTRAAAIRQLQAIEARKRQEAEKAGPTLSQVHTPGSDDEEKMKKQKQKPNDPMGALSHQTDDVTNLPPTTPVKDAPKKSDKDSVTNTPGAAKVKKDDLENIEKMVPIAKIDEEQKKVYGIVLEPDEVDTQGDTISEAEIEKAAEGFMKKARTIGLRHREVAKGVDLTDSYVTQGETTLGKTKLKKGTWIIGVKVGNETIWKGIKSGDFNGFSVGGFGKREKNA